MESRCTHGSGYARRRRVFVALSMNEQLTQWIVFLDRFWVLKSRFYWYFLGQVPFVLNLELWV
jgi:hypothetical protein